MNFRFIIGIKTNGLKHKPVLPGEDLSLSDLWAAPQLYHIIDWEPEVHSEYSTENAHLKQVCMIIPYKPPPFAYDWYSDFYTLNGWVSKFITYRVSPSRRITAENSSWSKKLYIWFYFNAVRVFSASNNFCLLAYKTPKLALSPIIWQ